MGQDDSESLNKTLENDFRAISEAVALFTSRFELAV